jgi:hypothetical protein
MSGWEPKAVAQRAGVDDCNRCIAVPGGASSRGGPCFAEHTAPAGLESLPWRAAGCPVTDRSGADC